MNVEDVLKRKGSHTITIRPTETVADASRLLRDQRIGAIVVSSDGQSIQGVISERDIAYGVAKHQGDLHALPVTALMTSKVITCHPEDKVAIAASVMSAHRIRHLPVVAGDRLVGMISIRDVLNLRVDELQQETARMHAFVMRAQAPQEDR